VNVALENVTKQTEQLEIPDSTVASLAGISNGQYSKFRNGALTPTRHHVQQIEKAVARLKKLIQQTDPLPLNFTKVGRLRSLIGEMEGGKIIIVTMRQAEESSDGNAGSQCLDVAGLDSVETSMR
jgi:hypothetical protein